MNDDDKSRPQLLEEITTLRQQMAKLQAQYEVELESRTRQRMALVELSEQILAGADLSSFFNQALRYIVDTLDFEAAAIWELQPDGKTLLMRAGIGWLAGRVGHPTLCLDTTTSLGLILDADEPIIVEKTRKERDPGDPALPHAFGKESSLSLRIKGQHGPFGLLRAVTGQSRHFSPSEIHLFQVIANILAAAVVRREAEEKLRQSEARNRAVLDAIPDLMFRMNRSGLFIDFIPAGDDEPKIGPAEFLGKTVHEVLPTLANQITHHVEQALLTNQIQTFEYEIFKHGQRQYYEARLAPSGEDEVLIITRNTTAQKLAQDERERLLAAEKEQRLLAETLAEVALALTSQISHEAVLDEILRQLYRIVSYKTANIMLLTGDKLKVVRWQGYESFDCAGFVAHLEQRLNDLPLDAMVVASRQPVLIPDTHQNPRWVILPETTWIRSYLSVPLCLRDQVLGLLRLDSDVPAGFSTADLERLEPLAHAAAVALENARLYDQAREELAERRRAEKQLIQSERLAALGRLAASLAHEINNPLQAMQSHLDLVLDFPVPQAEKEEYLQIIRQEVERLKNIVRHVLSFARPQPLAVQLVSVVEVIQHVLALSKKQLQQNNIEVITTYQIVPPVLTVPEHLSQVFLNLLINASEAISKNGWIHISVYQDGHEVAISFENSGPIIPKDVLNSLFEPFVSTKANGNGIGLWLSHTLIQQHNGTLQVKNLGNEVGVVFTVRLPAVRPSE